jgi:hypothetical protein
MPAVFDWPSFECAVVPGTSLVTDDWSGCAGLAKRGYKHLAIAERNHPSA